MSTKDVEMSLGEIISKNIHRERKFTKYSEKGIHKSRTHQKRTNERPRHTEKRVSRLLVKNLHHDVSESDLRQLFEEIGPVHKVRIRFDRSGRSEGFAEVDFPNEEHARIAIARYNGKPLDGMNLQIYIMCDPRSKLQKSNEYMQLDE